MNLKVIVFCFAVAVCVHLTAGEVDCENPPKPVNPRTCCTSPYFFTAEIKEQCKEFAVPAKIHSGESHESHENHEHDATKPEEHAHHHHHDEEHKHEHDEQHKHIKELHDHHRRPFDPRFVQCFFNHTGVVENSHLNEAKLSEYLHVAMKDATELVPVYEQAFKTCETKYQEYKKDHPEGEHKKHKRHAHFHPVTRIMACVFKEAFTHCPANVWSDTEECNQWRDVLTNCKDLRRVWHVLHEKHHPDHVHKDDTSSSEEDAVQA